MAPTARSPSRTLPSICVLLEASAGRCDTSTRYVTDLENYLESTADYVRDYCKSQTECRRRLEDAEEEEEEE
jgi:hypothetical protein